MDEPQQPKPYLTNEDFAHVGKGLLMGGADVVPGVSGGTIALIVGIYDRLVTAVSRCDGTLFGLVTSGRWCAAAAYVDLRFLVTLGLGIGCGVLALGSVMHFLLEHHLQLTYAAFFGLIGASCWLVGKMIPKWNTAEIAMLVIGAAVAVWVVNQPTLKHPPDGMWYTFFCGVIAICAMILPGISGSFILLILGKYHDITGIIKNAAHFEVNARDIGSLVVFAFGCLVGLLSFSKFLKWLLARHQSVTLATLTGFMLGSLCRIWPFQVDKTPEIKEFKDKEFQLLDVSEIPVDTQLALVIVIAVVSAAAVILLDRATSPHNSDEKPLVEEQ
ncbi:MAG: DUF368 domain-containing protein [Planctomycetaceae bacterium]|nr:DUF368 domain-containing protein [Planctomycetaceae bacterium]MCB9952096.1 DUF368 domain-containing protein [Planctomycetaceae bacterium]